MSQDVQPHIIRVTTVPISLHLLLTDQPKYLVQEGFKVSLCSSDGPEVRLIEESQGVPHHVILMTRKMTPLQDLASIIRMYRLLRQLKPGIVHSHTPKAGLVSMVAARLAGIPDRIHTVAGFRADTLTGVKRKLMLLMEKLTLMASTNVWPNSESLRQKLLEYRLCKSSKLDVIGSGSSNGIDLSDYSPDQLDPKVVGSVKTQIRYREEKQYLLFVGRVVRDKGLDELVDAFIRLKANHSELELILVGPMESHLDPLSKDTISIIQSRSDIHVIGYSNQVKYFMAIADVFVFPSHREGFPNVLLQAGAMKCPVICSDIGGNIDLIDDNITGLLHRVKDGESLENTIDHALKNPNRMAKMASELRDKIENRYDRQLVQQEIVTKYRKLLASRR